MSRRLSLLILVIGLPVCADEKKADPKAGDAAALKGTWEITDASFNGSKSAALKGRVLEFGDGEFTAYDGVKKGSTISFKLDPTTNPKGIELDRGSDGAKALGIYSIDKDELKICYAEPGSDRPKKFASTAGSKAFLIVLKRKQ